MDRMVSKKTRGVFVVHLLGQPAKLKEIQDFCIKRNLFLIEDCCESQGAKFNGKKVGNFGEMGSFSFYFGHHMTTVEGGMIVTNDFVAQDLLKSIRNHGMVRGTSRENAYPEFSVYNRFVFDVLGYNHKSTNINAAIGLVQLGKIDSSIERRVKNHEYFLSRIKDIDIDPQKVFLDETSSFSLGVIFPDAKKRELSLSKLPEYGIECRSIAGGNLLRHPVFRDHHFRSDLEIMANKIHDMGIYLPNNQFLREQEIDYMVNSIQKIKKTF